jgi:hypothetical protein
MEDAMRNIFFRVFIMLLVVTAFSAGCSNSSPSVKPATAEPDRISAEEPVEAVAEVSAIADASPTSESGPPAVFSYVILEGLLTVTSQRYEEVLDMCNPFPPGASGCMDTYNPCPEEGGGGGGGGGDDVACLKLPDYCYKCMPDYGATLFFSLFDPERVYISPSTTRFQIDVDPQGRIIRFDWGNSFSGFNPVQTDLTSEPGGFHTRWDLSNPNVTGKNPGYVIVDGIDISFNVILQDPDDPLSAIVLDLKGSGTWALGHPVFGDTGGGTWEFDKPDFYYFEVIP